MAKIKNYLLPALLLALPWQTRLIHKSVYIQDRFWEYGSLFLYGTEILAGILIIFWIADRLKDKNFRARFEATNIKRVATILSVYAVLILYFFISANRDLAWQYLNWAIYSVCLFVVIITSEFGFYKLGLFTWLGSLVPSVLGVIQFFSQSVFANKWLGLAAQDPAIIGVSVVQYLDERWLRAYGSFGSPNAFGVYLGAIFLLGIILVLNYQSDKAKAWILAGQAVIISALFFSFSRSAYIGVFAGLTVLIFQYRKNILFWRQIALYALIAIILSFSFSHLLFSRARLDNRLEVKSISERVTQWQDFKVIFSEHPLFGVGPGNYPVALRSLHSQASVNYLSPIHNIYLLFVGQFGLAGVIFVIFFAHSLYNDREKKIKIFAPLICLCIAGIFDHWLLSMFTGCVFLSLICALFFKSGSIDTLAPKE